MDDMKFAAILQKKGYRVTSQRIAVLKVICQSGSNNLSADEIYMRVKKAVPGIGIATVYKTLRIFEREGMISKTEFPDKIFRYEIMEDKSISCHMFCIGCGKTYKLKNSHVEALIKNMDAGIPFTPLRGGIMIYGYCSECAQKKNKKVKASC